MITPEKFQLITQYKNINLTITQHPTDNPIPFYNGQTCFDFAESCANKELDKKQILNWTIEILEYIKFDSIGRLGLVKLVISINFFQFHLYHFFGFI